MMMPATKLTLNEQAVTIIEATMEVQGISRTQLAKMLGVTKGRVTNILNAENMTLATLERIATEIGLTKIVLVIEYG
jgi:antitoxin component HigA of HigAB toxin-antitoxin module